VPVEAIGWGSSFAAGGRRMWDFADEVWRRPTGPRRNFYVPPVRGFVLVVGDDVAAEARGWFA